jgi:hypothetical protein
MKMLHSRTGAVQMTHPLETAQEWVTIGRHQLAAGATDITLEKNGRPVIFDLPRQGDFSMSSFYTYGGQCQPAYSGEQLPT